jgi:DNA polymerase III alpha subunit
VTSFPEFEMYLKRHNKGLADEDKIKPVYGVTLFIRSFNFDSRKFFHVKVYAKNQDGIKSIYRLVSRSFRLQGDWSNPYVTWEDVGKERELGNIAVVMPSVRGELFHVLARYSHETWAMCSTSQTSETGSMETFSRRW